MAQRLLILWLALILPNSALGGDLRAYFDRSSVFEGDTLTLVIESTSGALEQPELSGLERDFELLGTSQSTNISIVNGQRTDTIRLLVSLSPRRTGTIRVAPIPVGNHQTESLRLEVRPLPEGGSGGEGDDIFMELELGSTSDQLMVQQQAPLSLRLFTSRALLKGQLEDPRADGALITKLGEDRRYETQRNGRRYQVVERRYSLSPERSGELRIPPVRFEGSVRSDEVPGGPRRGLFDDSLFDRLFQNGPLSGDPFGMFQRGRPVSARSRAITLQIKARPQAYSGDHWLPAEELKILDSWAQSPPQLRAGEPVTRTLTVQAKGLSGPQIPELRIPTTAGLRVYPEPLDSETRSDGERVFAVSRQGITLIPSQAGTLAIPEIRMSWWDVVAQRQRTARVPGWTLQVAPGQATAAEPEARAQPPVPVRPHAEQDEAVRRQAESERAADSPPGPSGMERPYLIAAALAMLTVLVGIWGLYRRHRRSRAVAAPDPQSTAGLSQGPGMRAAEAKQALRTACRNDDPRGAAKALLAWARATWPEAPPHSLGTLGARLSRGREALLELEQQLYATESGHWRGAALWHALQDGLSDTPPAAPRPGSDLPPLYPRRG